MKQTNLLLAFGWALFASLNSSQASAQVACVDVETGNIIIVGTGYIGISLNSAEGNLIAANANANIGNGNNILDLSLAPYNLSWLHFAGFPNPVSLGNVIPLPITDPGDFSIDFVSGRQEDWGRFRPGIISFPFELCQCIPEPSTMMMGGMGLLGLCINRRRTA